MVSVRERNVLVAKRSFRKRRRCSISNIHRVPDRMDSTAVPYMLLIESRSDDQPYIPPTKPYELSNLAADLVLLARYLLKPRGRLVFFLPTVTDEYQEVDIHTMMCEGMEVVANSFQDFGSWGRRVS